MKTKVYYLIIWILVLGIQPGCNKEELNPGNVFNPLDHYELDSLATAGRVESTEKADWERTWVEVAPGMSYDKFMKF